MNHDIQINVLELPEPFRQYVCDTIDLCTAHRVALTLSKARGIDNGEGAMVNGWFSDDPKEFKVATGQSLNQWQTVFIHESCHMDQWLEDTSVWFAISDPSMTTYDHLSLDEMTHIQRADYIQRFRDVELDCEKRTAAKLRTLGIDVGITVDEYIQKSNAYVWFYNIFGVTGKWYSLGREPYNIPEIWRNLPIDFDNDYEDTPQYVVDLMMEHLYD